MLAALPAEDYQRLRPHLEPVPLHNGQVLSWAGEPLEYVYFLDQGTVVSLVSTMADGSTIEVGLVGQEGMIDVSAFLSDSPLPIQSIVQVPGSGMRMPVRVLKAEFERGGTLQYLLLRYIQALYIQSAQTAACNRLHTLEARLARWLLLVHDRVHSNQLRLTQEFISHMLGVRRAGVTQAVSILQQAEVIHHNRGKITILDLKALEATSCECYWLIQKEFTQLLPNRLLDESS